MTVLAAELALFNAQNWTIAGWVVVVGAALDVLRYGVDRLFGRPGVRYLNEASRWAKDSAFMMRQNALIGCILLPPAVILLALGVVYASGAPFEGQRLSGLYRAVAERAPDVSSTVQVARRWGTDLRNHGLPERALVVTSFVSLMFVIVVAATVVGVTFAARRFAMYQSGWARKQGARSFSDQTVVVVAYMFFLILSLGPIVLSNHGSKEFCLHPTISICNDNGTFFVRYGMISVLGLFLSCFLQSFLENGCHEHR